MCIRASMHTLAHKHMCMYVSKYIYIYIYIYIYKPFEDVRVKQYQHYIV